MSRLNEQLESEKLELLSVVERKNQEIDRLNGMKINIFVLYLCLFLFVIEQIDSLWLMITFSPRNEKDKVNMC